MFPFRDHNPSGRTPYVTWTLIGLNVLVFILMLPLDSNPRALYAVYDSYAMIPAKLHDQHSYLTLISSMFMHGGFMHLIGNMLFLYIYGDNLEDQMGHIPYLLFYLACGVVAGLAHYFSALNSPVPTVGASGAIAGVMGGYLLLFPRAKVDVLIIFVFLFKILTLPAWLLLALWFALQLFSGFTADPMSGGVAYWAHTGGFVIGVLLTIPVFLRNGGPDYWNRTHGEPPHPVIDYQYRHTSIPRVRRKR